MIMSLIHPVRGLIGLYIIRLLPQTQDVFNKMYISGGKQLRYTDTVNYLSSQTRLIILDYYQYYELPAKIYSGVSIICLICDLIAALVFLIFQGKHYQPNVFLACYFIVTLSFFGDIFLVTYVLHLRFRLPTNLKNSICKAVVGFGTEMKELFLGESKSS